MDKDSIHDPTRNTPEPCSLSLGGVYLLKSSRASWPFDLSHGHGSTERKNMLGTEAKPRLFSEVLPGPRRPHDRGFDSDCPPARGGRASLERN